MGFHLAWPFYPFNLLKCLYQQWNVLDIVVFLVLCMEQTWQNYLLNERDWFISSLYVQSR
jgi:hypothetical protein